MKRERRGEAEEARSWESYTHLLKWGIRVEEEAEFPTERQGWSIASWESYPPLIFI